MLNDTDQWLGVEQLPRFKDPLTALLWGSRIYLVHASSGEPAPPALHLLFSKVLCSDTEAALQQVLDFMMFHSTIPLAVHALDCECVSAHEQALADAIRAVQAGSLVGYQNAMAGVLLDDDAMTIGPQIQCIANALRHIEHAGFVQSAVTVDRSTATDNAPVSQYH
ncbi:MAG: hypothetical protein AAF270_03420 [Pseudomonadota bacterium]